jgi:hypothetical protein
MTDSAQPFAAKKFLEIEGRRMAYIDEGEVVKLFREDMERNLRPDPVPDAIWALPATASSN